MTPDLRAKAEKATKGPWQAFLGEQVVAVMTTERKAHGNGVTVVNWPGFDSSDQTRKKDRANAAYIAAASPDVALALLDERDRLRAALEEAGRRLSRWSHDEDCCVWTCETCDRIDPGDHLSGHEDPTHAGCDCGIAEIVSYLEAALIDAQPGQEEP